MEVELLVLGAELVALEVELLVLKVELVVLPHPASTKLATSATPARVFTRRSYAVREKRNGGADNPSTQRHPRRRRTIRVACPCSPSRLGLAGR